MSPCTFLGLFAVYFDQAASAATTKGDLYDQMPPLNAVDEYASCLRARGDAYCFLSAKLHGNASQPLYNYLLEYSANNLTHFDRTNVHRGICLKKTCQEFLNISPNVTIALEGCLNDTLARNYGLTARVFRTICREYRERVQFDASDFAFGAVVLILLALNLLGSLYDCCGSGEDTIVARSLRCFSVRRNWQKLMASPTRDPIQSRLLGLSGYRMFFIFFVMVLHTSMSGLHSVENVVSLEEAYNNSLFIIMCRSPEALQIIYIISGLLLASNLLKSAEHANGRNLHTALLHRWLRLTPVYAFMLFFISTWARHASEGPFWGAIVEVEANDCRRDWWLHLLFIHNYVDNSRCMLHSWSMAADMQLTFIGVMIFLVKSERARKVAIALLLVLGMLAPAAAIYLHNLPPILIAAPEVVRGWFVHDPTMNYLYKRGHTNLLCYVLGMVLGYIVYNLKETDLGAEKYKKFRVVYWLLIPALLVLLVTGSPFYDPELVVPLPVRLFYSSTVKLITGLILCSHIFLTILKADRLSTKILRWRAWTPLARLAFCIYMVHMSVIRIRDGALNAPLYLSSYTGARRSLENLIATFLLALPLFLLVEAPIGNATRLFLSPPQKKRAD